MEEPFPLDDRDLQALTMLPRKGQLYRVETFLREAWNDACGIFGAETIVTLHGTAMLMLKPELFAARRHEIVLNFVMRHGFRPVAFATLTLTRLMAHEIWRYQWNKATTERVQLATAMAMAGPSILVIFRDEEPAPAVPASVRLWSLKGAADPRSRKGDELRSAIPVRNRMIGFVHTSDEPADMLREIGIVLDVEERADLLRSVLAQDPGTGERLRRAAGRVASGAAHHDFDVAASWAAIEPALRRWAGAAPDRSRIVDALRRHVSGRADGEFLDGRMFFDCLAQAGVPADGWPAMTVAAEYIRHEYRDTPPILDAGAIATVREQWRAAAAANSFRETATLRRSVSGRP